MSIRCFWLEPTDQERLQLRRYHSGDGCGGDPKAYHEAMVDFGTAPGGRDANGFALSLDHLKPRKDDPRWPRACARCGVDFLETDSYQLFQGTLFRRSDTGELVTLRDAPAGAMWDAWWFGRDIKGGPWGAGVGDDGRWLVVKTPGGDWMPDQRASNCTMPEDNEHRCWVRHGTPPDITVDKNGKTCGAGAGSIQCGAYHGFLQAGSLT